MVDKFDLLTITPWKFVDNKWTLSAVVGPYTTCSLQIIRIVIVDDSVAYALRLKHMLMKIVKCNEYQQLEIKTFIKLADAEKYLSLFKCTLVFVDNIFPDSSTGLMMAQRLLMDTEQCPTTLVMMSGEEMETSMPSITKVHKNLIDRKKVCAFLLQAGINHHPRKLNRGPRKLNRIGSLTTNMERWTVGKDPRPKRVRVLNSRGKTIK